MTVLHRFQTLACLMLWLLSSLWQPVAVASEVLPDYQRATGVSGNLFSTGSDTLANLMTLWAESFKRVYPGVRIEVQAAGSSTAPPALTQGTASLGPMSRPMKNREREAFEARYGYLPTAVPVALDAVAIYVHQDNPLQRITLEQVDAIFSATRRCGAPSAITHWHGLGLTGVWETQHIQMFGRNSVSGTYGYFKAAALCNGDFKAQVNEQPGSASVVQAISTAVNGIGYSALGYRTASVKTLAVAVDAQGPYVVPNAASAIRGDYPLSRYMYIYVNKEPGKRLPPLEREFLAMILSQRGQSVVVKDGYTPLPADVVSAARESLAL
ncbi:MAG: phosphate ABC transporter substrate-binding protein PstS family protein [Pseudomonadota bacterium]